MRKIDLMEAAGKAFGASADYMRGWNDAVDAMPRMISVKERLPEDDGYYLVWAFGNGVFAVAMYCGDGEWLADELVNITRFVTHWMPLPEPPGEDA